MGESHLGPSPCASSTSCIFRNGTRRHEQLRLTCCFITARICKLDDGLYDLLLHCAECRSLDTTSSVTEWSVIALIFEALRHDELLVVIISKCIAAVINYDEPTGQLQFSCKKTWQRWVRFY